MTSLSRKIAEVLLRTGEKQLLPTGLVLALWKCYGFAYPLHERIRTRVRSSGLNLAGQDKSIEANAAFFRRHFSNDLLAFWKKHAPDELHGGFFSHLDRRGRVYDDSLKTSAMQARMLYGFSLGYRLNNDQECLELARQALDFLIARCWDREHSGWYESVDREGRPHCADKDSFTQAYVLLGLAECYKHTGEPRALDFAYKTYDLLEHQLRDTRHQGYYERCQRDWQVSSSDKTICIHLDMLIALMALFECSGRELHLQRARELGQMIRSRFLHRPDGSLLERFSRDWKYLPWPTRDQLLLGHCFKAAWLLLELNRLSGSREQLEFVRRLLDFCLEKGWDKRYGGFYQYLFRGGRPAAGNKIWWAQCEGLQALLGIYTLCGEQKYWDYFQRLMDFSFAHFHDAEHGEWVSSLNRDGTVLDANKGGNWKAAYHTLQMCYYVQSGLKVLERKKW